MGGGGGTLCQSEGTHQIVMSFSPPVVDCLLKIALQKGGGGAGSRAPQDLPGYVPAHKITVHLFLLMIVFGSSVQTLIKTLLRNVMLTVPKGVWATCGDLYLESKQNKFTFFSYFFCKKTPLSRHVGYVMDGSVSESVRDVCMSHQLD